MLSSRTTSRFAPAACALALLFGGVLAPSASARAVKAAAPSLTIEAKNCSIGATEDLRSATVTSLALLGTTGERVSMRFSVQSRQGKSRWKSLLFKDPATTKQWETTDAAGAGLRLTKIFPKLPEGYEYRVVVEARSIDADGKVVTKTARKYVPCNQPLFTPTVSLASAAWKPALAEDGTKTGQYYLSVGVRNAGRLPADSVTVTVADATTLVQFFQTEVGPIKGRSVTAGQFTGPSCTDKMLITVQLKDADPATLTPEQTKTISCAWPGEKASTSAKLARR